MRKRHPCLVGITVLVLLSQAARRRSTEGGELGSPPRSAGASSAPRLVAAPARSTPLAVATAPSTQSAATAPVVFSHAKPAISLSYPAAWVSKPSQDFELLIERDQGGSRRTISLDIPDLPMHVPGMIPLGMVKNGYLDDLRKQEGKIESKDLPPPKVPGAQGKMVRSTWQAKDGRPMVETALLLVHDDHVFILRATSEVAAEPETRDTFDAMVRSLQWAAKK